MEIAELRDLLHNNIKLITDVDKYKKIISRSNNLKNFDLINKVLVLSQCDNAVDIKTEDCWLLDGRKLNSKAKPIYLIAPVIKYSYIELETGETVDLTTITSDELNKALEYNLIEKTETIDDLYTIKVYDIRDTVSASDTEYVYKRKTTNSKELLEITENIMNVDIVLCEDDFYSKQDKTIYLSKKPFRSLVYTLSRYISQFIIDVYNEECTDNSIYNNKYLFKLLKETVTYSIYTLLSDDNTVGLDFDFDLLDTLDYTSVLEVINLADLLVDNIEIINGTHSEAITDIHKIKKADALLNVLEANAVRNKLIG